jgi:pimeloyl-ACP methyl ester carboxylesterase
MPTIAIDGIATHYEISGSGPPMLMMAPGGFDSAIVKWSTTWPWQHFLPLRVFAQDYTCIAYDRREAGQSGPGGATDLGHLRRPGQGFNGSSGHRQRLYHGLLPGLLTADRLRHQPSRSLSWIGDRAAVRGRQAPAYRPSPFQYASGVRTRKWPGGRGGTGPCQRELSAGP